MGLNPIIQALSNGTNHNKVKKFLGIVNALKYSGNPQMLLQQLMSTNPDLQQVQDLINQNGGNPEETFYSLAKQMGVNPDMILKMLNNKTY